MLDRGLQHWLPTYIGGIARRRRLRRQRGVQLNHVLFLVCDHFEPAHGVKDDAQASARMRAWHEGYASMQAQVHARSGLRPLHTWFYPPHHGYEHLPSLARMAFDGLGEVELHYHHSDDTEETMRADLLQVLARYRSAGLLLQAGAPPRAGFGFIHGDWALDNSANGEYCGVDSELSLLQELGCWADLTMPSGNRAQTRKINSIYYAIDDPLRPKSHDWGQDAKRGVTDSQGLMLIQGPLALNLRAPGHPRIENASLTTENWGRPDRIESWLDCHVHVDGRPDWLFVKLHAHGAIERDWDALFGERALRMHDMLCRQYNDGKRWRMHYVTARQARNVIRAAEAGAEGDPSQYFDFEIPAPATSFYCFDVPHRLLACTAEHLHLATEESVPGHLQVRSSSLRALHGTFLDFSWREARGELDVRLGPGQELRIELVSGSTLVDGQAPVARSARPGCYELRVEGAWRLRVRAP